MKILKKTYFVLVVCFTVLPGCYRETDAVSFVTLLQEMAGRRSLTKLPDYELKQASSYETGLNQILKIPRHGSITRIMAIISGRKLSGAHRAVFSPNILSSKGKYYLFYTGVKPSSGNTDGEFENNSKSDYTAIGIAVAESPDGPFFRIGPKPVIEVSNDTTSFDSYRVDDAALLRRNAECWLFFKGRSLAYGQEGPSLTQMGVAFAEKPGGPYKKFEIPVLSESHEVLV